jgi:glycosyltransferase involved in cell wall biosynthesis
MPSRLMREPTYRVKHLRYSALIRTFNSAKTIEDTIRFLESQSIAPQQYIIVDSGSTDDTLAKVPPNSKVIRFEGAKFNYSSAINQGLAHVGTDYVLIISSHTELLHRGALEYALEQLRSNARLGAAYFCNEVASQLGGVEIDRTKFTGFNGVWNTCALFRTELLRRRAFRPEVFAAEDQEWSRWLLENTAFTILRVSGCGFKTRNPVGYPHKKRLDEHEAIALYSVPSMLLPVYLLRVCYRVVRPISSLQERWYNLQLLSRLVRRALESRRSVSARTIDEITT